MAPEGVVCMCVCLFLHIKYENESRISMEVKKRAKLHLGKEISECEIIIMAVGVRLLNIDRFKFIRHALMHTHLSEAIFGTHSSSNGK